MIELSEKDIRLLKKLMKEVKKLDVISFELGTIKIKFAEESLAPRRAFKPSKKAADVIALERDQRQRDSVNREVAVMHVEDPSGFEQALIENDLDELREGDEEIRDFQIS